MGDKDGAGAGSRGRGQGAGARGTRDVSGGVGQEARTDSRDHWGTGKKQGTGIRALEAPLQPSRPEGQGTLRAPSMSCAPPTGPRRRFILVASSQVSFLELVVFEPSFADMKDLAHPGGPRRSRGACVG